MTAPARVWYEAELESAERDTSRTDPTSVWVYSARLPTASQSMPTFGVDATTVSVFSGATTTLARERVASRRQAANAELLPHAAPVSTRDYSPEFRKLRMRQAFRDAREALVEFGRTLGTTESAVWMTQYRSALESLWKFVPPEDAYRSRGIAAVQAAIRFEKWRTLTPQATTMLARAVELVSAPEFRERDGERVYSVLHSGGIDLFPSSDVDAADEDEAE